MASPMTLRIMQRIVDKELGPQSLPKQNGQTGMGHTGNRDAVNPHLSQSEVKTLKKIIHNDTTTNSGSVAKILSDSVKAKNGSTQKAEGFAERFNQARLDKQQAPSTTQAPTRMNLDAFVKSKKG